MKHKRTSLLTASILLIILIILMAIPLSLGDTPLTTDTSEDTSPSITQTSDGKIWVVWNSYRTDNLDLFYKTYDGISWSSPAKPLTTDLNDDELPSIIQTNDGKIWVVWTSLRTLNYDLFCKTSHDNGSSWSPETPLTTHTGVDSSPSIMQSSDGKIWVTWHSRRTGNYDLFCKTSSNGGSSWSPETPLTTDPNEDKDPSIMQVSDGEIWVVWQARRVIQDDIYYKIYNGSSWSLENKLTWFMDDDITPAIFQNTNGTIGLAWATDEPGNFDIYYKSVIVDIAIKDVTTSSTSVLPGDPLDILVEVHNEGTAGATFSVTAYYNETAIGTETRTLTPGLIPGFIFFTWDTTGEPLGHYIISAQTSLIVAETDTADNIFINGLVVVGSHDVALKTVTPSRSLVHRGYTPMDIYVEVGNEGTFSETFSVIAYYNSTEIGTQIITLTPNSNTTLTFPWDTTTIPYSNYVISASATTVSYETDLADNSLTDGMVIVTIPGDISGDKTVDISDAGQISAHWHSPPFPDGPLGYDPNADINNDGRVNILDVSILNANWHKSW